MLANLAGFDGSPESMREWQLEYGAEIGRAVVNFDGPIVFCVVSRYHGGAFVVFSQRLNENLEAVGARGRSRLGHRRRAGRRRRLRARRRAGGARSDARIVALDERIAAADGAERLRLRSERAELWATVLSEKRGELAAEFDAVHSVERAVQMGSVRSHHRAGDAAPLPHRRGRARHAPHARRAWPAMTAPGWLTARRLRSRPTGRRADRRLVALQPGCVFLAPLLRPWLTVSRSEG